MQLAAVLLAVVAIVIGIATAYEARYGRVPAGGDDLSKLVVRVSFFVTRAEYFCAAGDPLPVA